MESGQGNAAAEAEIRALIEERGRAANARDIDAATAIMAPDATVFCVLGPLQRSGLGAARASLEQWFSSFRADIAFELRDLSVTAVEDVAFSHSLTRVGGTTRAGTDIDMWWRSTVCYHKLDRAWQTTQEHTSVPFNPATGKASLDLAP